MCIELVKDEDGDYYDVHGQVPGEENGCALDLCLFGEWAGFLLDKELLSKMSFPEIAAHVLWEMTFCGYSDENILARRREIEEALRECEEHPERCFCFSEVLDGNKKEES